jgi:hypothetical protein
MTKPKPDELYEKLKEMNIPFEIVTESFYGLRVINFLVKENEDENDDEN